MEGWIKLHRKILEWEWYKDDKTFRVFIYLLLSANFENKKWKGIEVNRGQLITGRMSISENVGISERSVRTCLNRLKTTSELTIKTTNRYSLITINKYEAYQINEETNDQKTDQQTANKRPTNDQQTTTTKEYKKEKKEKNIRKEEANKSPDFIDSIVNCFVEEHGNYEVIIPGKEREMAGKILKIYKKRFPDANSEETLMALRDYFKSCINIQDAWLKNNMSLSIIVSKFNEINKILSNGTNKGSGATDKEFAEFYANRYGTDAFVE